MSGFRRSRRLFAAAIVVGLSVLAVLASTANAIGEPTTIIFKELEKGETSHFVDSPPKATLNHGVVSISPGDEVLSTNPLAMEGKVVGKIRVVCTATTASNTKHLDSAGFICNGIAKLPDGTLVLVAEAGEGPAEGAVTGGTGIYAGARGTFAVRRGRGGSTNTVTLLG